MPIETMILYGSCARGDTHKDSDIDIFAIDDISEYRSMHNGKLNFTICSRDFALDRARSGDLFMLHLIKEGKIIYDNACFFPELQESYRFKSNYSNEIKSASDLGWFLIVWADVLKSRFSYGKRMAWCVRTILIALSVQGNAPIFAAQKLADFSRTKYVKNLINEKSKKLVGRKSIENFEKFLKKFGCQMPEVLGVLNMASHRKYFEETSNSMGLHVVNNLLHNDHGENYF